MTIYRYIYTYIYIHQKRSNNCVFSNHVDSIGQIQSTGGTKKKIINFKCKPLLYYFSEPKC